MSQTLEGVFDQNADLISGQIQNLQFVERR
jgi:hypothetical protein